MAKIDPPEVSDSDVDAAIAKSLASGDWKEAKNGDKTYYYDKVFTLPMAPSPSPRQMLRDVSRVKQSTLFVFLTTQEKKKSLHRKGLVSFMREKLIEDGTAERKTEVAKKVKQLLRDGIWKMVKGDKPYYYNPKDKKEVVWDLEHKVAVELGYAQEVKGKERDKKEKKEKKDEKDSDKKKKDEKKEEKDDKKKKEKKEKKESKAKDAVPEAAPQADPTEDAPRSTSPEPREASQTATEASTKHEDASMSPEPSPSPMLEPELPPPPLKMKAPTPKVVPQLSPPASVPTPAEDAAAARQARDEEQRHILEQMLAKQQGERDAENLAAQHTLHETEEYIRVYTLGFSEELERTVMQEEFQRVLLQHSFAATLQATRDTMRSAALNALQTHHRAELHVDERYAFEGLLAAAVTSFGVFYRLQIERYIHERLILGEIEEEERDAVLGEEEVCRDALLIVERRHQVWSNEVASLVAAWVTFTQTKFSEFFLDGVKWLQHLKEVETHDRQLVHLRASLLRDCREVEAMARREIENEWRQRLAEEHAGFDALCAAEAKRRRDFEKLPSYAADKQLDLIRSQIAELKRRRSTTSPDPPTRQKETAVSEQRLHRLQASSRECELARIGARVRKLEDDSIKHRGALGGMREASRKSASKVKDPTSSLGPLRLQVESLRALQSHNEVVSAQPPNTDVYQQILAFFYSRHDPTKVANIPVLLQQFKGNETALFNGLVQKYRLPTNNPYKDSLRTIMQRAVPWQLPCIDVILHLYEGSEYDLVNHLMQTYQ